MRTTSAEVIGQRRPIGWGFIVFLAIGIGALSACSDDAETSSGESGEAAAVDGASSPEPELFTGDLEDFYVAPDPLPDGEPGDLIRIMEVDESDDARTLRVMYLSQDAQDADRAVTGTITHPLEDASDEGWPVVSWAHGTTGMAPPCAPSRGDDPAPGFGIEGVHVATDYIGLGPEGELHPYLSKEGEGHASVDIVRAARQLSDTGAGDRWLSVGHSQGGHGALAAHELSDEYAPELELLGTAAFAPAAVFDETFGPADEIVTGIGGFMGFYGAAGEHPAVELDDYLTPEAAEAATAITEGCLPEIIEALLDVGVDGFYTVDPLETEPVRSVLLSNDVGSTAVDAPVLLVGGTDDPLVVVERVFALEERLCAVDQVTELVITEGADHDNLVGLNAEKLTSWLEARLDGEDPTNTCTGQN